VDLGDRALGVGFDLLAAAEESGVAGERDEDEEEEGRNRVVACRTRAERLAGWMDGYSCSVRPTQEVSSVVGRRKKACFGPGYDRRKGKD